MGENAFVAYTVVGVLGYSWQTALGAVFISGVLFTVLTTFRPAGKMIDAVPDNLNTVLLLVLVFLLLLSDLLMHK